MVNMRVIIFKGCWGVLWCRLGVELLEQEYDIFLLQKLYFTGFYVAKQSCVQEVLSSLNLQIPKNDFTY